MEQRTKRAKTKSGFRNSGERGGIVVFGKVERRWGTDGNMERKGGADIVEKKRGIEGSTAVL